MGKREGHNEGQMPAGGQASRAPDRRRRASACLLLTGAGASLGLLSLQHQAPRLIWNFTESVPVGLYGVAQTEPAKGDLVAIAPAGHARAALDAYDALSGGMMLLKHLEAVQGDIVCRIDTSIIINGVITVTARLRSSDGRTLPAWSGCRTLGGGEVLVLAPHASSFDGRYFGPIGNEQIVGVAKPLLTFAQEGAP